MGTCRQTGAYLCLALCTQHAHLPFGGEPCTGTHGRPTRQTGIESAHLIAHRLDWCAPTEWTGADSSSRRDLFSLWPWPRLYTMSSPAGASTEGKQTGELTTSQWPASPRAITVPLAPSARTPSPKCDERHCRCRNTCTCPPPAESNS